MINLKELAKALCVVLSDPRIGQDCWLSNDDGPRPEEGYTTVGTPRVIPLMRDTREYTNETAPGAKDLDETIRGLRQLDFSIICHRGDTRERAERARIAFRQTWVQDALLKMGLAFTSVSDIRSLTEPSDAAMMSKHQFDVSLMTEQSFADIVLSIESVTIVGDYQGAFKHHTDTITVEKPTNG